MAKAPKKVETKSSTAPTKDTKAKAETKPAEPPKKESQPPKESQSAKTQKNKNENKENPWQVVEGKKSAHKRSTHEETAPTASVSVDNSFSSLVRKYLNFP